MISAEFARRIRSILELAPSSALEQWVFDRTAEFAQRIRSILELPPSCTAEVSLDEEGWIGAVMIDGQAASPEQWLRLTRAGLPMLQRPELDDGEAITSRGGDGR